MSRCVIVVFALLCLSLASDRQQRHSPPPHALTGEASWYSDHILATGERFDATAYTAAHPTLPMCTNAQFSADVCPPGSIIRVKNLQNGMTLVVRINDRGPYVSGRVLDLTPAGAEALGIKVTGLAPVALTVLN